MTSMGRQSNTSTGQRVVRDLKSQAEEMQRIADEAKRAAAAATTGLTKALGGAAPPTSAAAASPSAVQLAPAGQERLGSPPGSSGDGARADDDPVSQAQALSSGLNTTTSAEAMGRMELEAQLSLQDIRAEDARLTKARARREVREMIVYLMFVALFTFVMIFGKNNQMNFFLTDSIRVQFTEVEFNLPDAHIEKTFNDVATVEEFWQWMHGPFFKAVYTASTFDGDSAFPQVQSSSGGVPNRAGYMLGKSRFVGAVRLGSFRSAPDPVADCLEHVPEEVAGFDSEWMCWNMDGLAMPDDRSFGTPRPFRRYQGDEEDVEAEHALETPIVHFKCLEESFCAAAGGDAEQCACEEGVWEPSYLVSTTSSVFPEPNTWVVLPNPIANPAETAVAGGSAAQAAAGARNTSELVHSLIHQLRDNKFIDLKTRGVSVDLALFNPSLDRFVVTRLMAELPAAGGVIPSSKFLNVRAYQLFSANDVVRLVLEVFMLAMTLYYTVAEVRNISRSNRRLSYLTDSGNLAHITNMTFIYISTGLRVYAFTTMPVPTAAQVRDPFYFVPFRAPTWMMEVANDINAFNALLTWLKVFKYLNFIPHFKILLGTLSRASERVKSFVVICAVVLFGSSQAYMMAFGTVLYEYRNLTQSFFSLLRALLGEFDFEPLRVTSPLLGPVMFFLFILLAVFVLLNMFIAIISDAFYATKESLAEEDDIGLSVLGGEVRMVILHEGLYRLPLLGPRLQRAGERLARHAARVQRLGRSIAGRRFERDVLQEAGVHEDEVPKSAEEVAEEKRRKTARRMGFGAVTDVVSLARPKKAGSQMSRVAKWEFATKLMQAGAEEESAAAVATYLDGNDDGYIPGALLAKVEEQIAQEERMVNARRLTNQARRSSALARATAVNTLASPRTEGAAASKAPRDATGTGDAHSVESKAAVSQERAERAHDAERGGRAAPGGGGAAVPRRAGLAPLEISAASTGDEAGDEASPSAGVDDLMSSIKVVRSSPRRRGAQAMSMVAAISAFQKAAARSRAAADASRGAGDNGQVGSAGRAATALAESPATPTGTGGRKLGGWAALKAKNRASSSGGMEGEEWQALKDVLADHDVTNAMLKEVISQLRLAQAARVAATMSETPYHMMEEETARTAVGADVMRMQPLLPRSERAQVAMLAMQVSKLQMHFNRANKRNEETQIRLDATVSGIDGRLTELSRNIEGLVAAMGSAAAGGGGSRGASAKRTKSRRRMRSPRPQGGGADGAAGGAAVDGAAGDG